MILFNCSATWPCVSPGSGDGCVSGSLSLTPVPVGRVASREIQEDLEEGFHWSKGLLPATGFSGPLQASNASPHVAQKERTGAGPVLRIRMRIGLIELDAVNELIEGNHLLDLQEVQDIDQLAKVGLAES